jgi:hypothetical protein
MINIVPTKSETNVIVITELKSLRNSQDHQRVATSVAPTEKVDMFESHNAFNFLS